MRPAVVPEPVGDDAESFDLADLMPGPDAEPAEPPPLYFFSSPASSPPLGFLRPWALSQGPRRRPGISSNMAALTPVRRGKPTLRRGRAAEKTIGTGENSSPPASSLNMNRTVTGRHAWGMGGYPVIHRDRTETSATGLLSIMCHTSRAGYKRIWNCVA